jgi:hypothetical protein
MVGGLPLAGPGGRSISPLVPVPGSGPRRGARWSTLRITEAVGPGIGRLNVPGFGRRRVGGRTAAARRQYWLTTSGRQAAMPPPPSLKGLALPALLSSRRTTWRFGCSICCDSLLRPIKPGACFGHRQWISESSRTYQARAQCRQQWFLRLDGTVDFELEGETSSGQDGDSHSPGFLGAPCTVSTSRAMSAMHSTAIRADLSK